MILAVKCAPQRDIFSNIRAAGIEAVELYLSRDIMRRMDDIITLCREFSFRYAVHAPNDCYMPDELLTLCGAIGAQTAVFHDIFWQDEWETIARFFKGSRALVCVENIGSIHESLKFMRRFGFGRCLDIEHLQMQCGGIYEREFIPLVQGAAHLHMTGYIPGSKLWHTHIHASGRHNRHILDLVRASGYQGLLVSEAAAPLQTLDEFKRLKKFYDTWEKGTRHS